MNALELWLMELLLDHDVSMLRVEAEAKAKVLALLMAMQKDLVALIANSPNMSALGKADKNAILRESNVLIAKYYGAAQLEVDLGALAQVEAAGIKAALLKIVDLSPGAELPTQAELKAAISEVRAAAAAAKNAEAIQAAAVEVRLGVALPTENYLDKLAGDALIHGSPAKNWWLRQQQDTAFKLANEIRIGAAQGETNQQIIARIVGTEVTTAKLDEAGKPGIMPLARRNAASIVQTAMATVAAEARRASFQANRDLMNGIIQHSTLDGHTSLTCIAYDGATWDMDYEPILHNDLPYNGGVPRHWSCRSAEAALMKTYREMGIPLDEPTIGTRASSSGQVSAKMTFADYLKMKGEDYQNEVLGKARAEMFRAGKLTPRDLVDMRGNPLKLEQLQAQYGREFRQPSGQFTIYDPGYNRVAPDVSTPARAAAVKFEEAIRRDSLETGAFFRADGSLIVARSGQPDRVAFSGKDLAGTNGALFTHNHPGGGSFSVADIENGAGLRLAEVRAVAPDYRHIMTPVGAWPSEQVIQRAFDAEATAAYREVDRMVKAGELSVKYAATEIQHQQWVRAARALGLTYIREGS